MSIAYLRLNHKLIIFLSFLFLVISLSLGIVEAEAHDNKGSDNLALRLSERFGLNRQEVDDFLKQYFSENHHHTYIDTRNETGYRYVKNHDEQKVKSTEVRYVASPVIVNETRPDHIAFIDAKMSEGVEDGWFSQPQKTLILAKIKEKMDNGPTPETYRNMGEDQRREQINIWKREMSEWSVKNGFTLARIRNITGKGNKYLMGMEL